MELNNTLSDFNFPGKKCNQKKWLALFAGILFSLLIHSEGLAQFIGADFQYAVYSKELNDTLPLSIAEPAILMPAAMDAAAPNKFKVTLKLYFNCNHEDFYPQQPVTVHEHEANLEVAALNLILDSVSSIKDYLNVACESAKEQCLKVATYSALVELKDLYGGYDISWGTCCWDYSVTNLDNLKMQGLAMVLHLPSASGQKPNSSPSFLEAPRVLTCPDKIMANNSMAVDRDGDRLTYKLIHPFTFEQEINTGSVSHEDLFPGQNTHTPIVVGRPPFKKMVYASGFGYKNPLGSSQFTIDAETGTLETNPKEPGRYLVGIGVEETRNNVRLSETQRVFLFEVITDPVSFQQIENN